MKPELSKPKLEFVPNPYVEWGQTLNLQYDRREYAEILRNSFSNQLRPVFVEAKDPKLTAQQFFEKIDKLNTKHLEIRYHLLEKELNEETAKAHYPVEAVLYIPADWKFEVEIQSLLDFCHLLYVGPAIVLPVEIPAVQHQPPPYREKFPVLAGVIDDGLAFLNTRFQNSGTTRIIGLWVQSVAIPVENNPHAVQLGNFLYHEEIQKLVVKARTQSEKSVYRKFYREFDRRQKPTTRPIGLERTVEHHISHGTHILDLAAGAPPSDHPLIETPESYLRDIPIIVAQLPPQSVDDTSGVRLEIHAIQALRWMLLEALKNSVEHLIVNFSFGVSAGAKNGTRFLEQQLQREVDRARRHGIELHIVLPFGNEYRSRLVQDLSVTHAVPGKAEISLPRADETPSFIEVRPKSGYMPEGLEIALEAPNGEMSSFVEINPGQTSDITRENRTFGKIYHVAEQTFGAGRDPYPAYILFSFAPTAEPRAPTGHEPSHRLTSPGRWKLLFKTPKKVSAELILQVQRDDSSFGYHRPGQQAWFDDERAYEYSELFRNQSHLSEESPITHDMTNTAYVTRVSTNVHTVGAARTFKRKCEDPNVPAPAYNASQGFSRDDNVQIHPDAGVIVDRFSVTPGLLASGTVSGSTGRLNGSSVAAAAFARKLLLETAPHGKFEFEGRKPSPEAENRLGRKVYDIVKQPSGSRSLGWSFDGSPYKLPVKASELGYPLDHAAWAKWLQRVLTSIIRRGFPT